MDNSELPAIRGASDSSQGTSPDDKGSPPPNDDSAEACCPAAHLRAHYFILAMTVMLHAAVCACIITCFVTMTTARKAQKRR